MAEWNPDWERKLAEPPLPGKRFTEDMKMEVLNRLEGRATRGGGQEHRRLKRVRLRGSFVAGVLVVMLAVPGAMILWQGMGADAQPGTVPNQGQVGPNGLVQAATPDGMTPSPISIIREGDGGNLAWWREWSPPERTVSDTTLVAFVQALLEKRIGAMGGPGSIDALWERTEDKQVLARYELSSPWVEEVYVEAWYSEKQHVTKFDSQTKGPWTIYELRLVLTDSTRSCWKKTCCCRSTGQRARFTRSPFNRMSRQTKQEHPARGSFPPKAFKLPIPRFWRSSPAWNCF